MPARANPNNPEPLVARDIFPGPPKSPIIGAATVDPDDEEAKPPPMESSGADTERTMLTEDDVVEADPQAPVAPTQAQPACKECTCKDGVCPCKEPEG